MDPLSISMAILTVIGATRGTINAAKSLYNAPEELESLLNDLADAELMIRDIKSYVGDHHEASTSLQEKILQERLVEAEGVVLELKTLIIEVVEKPEDPSSVRRYKWFKAKKKTRKLAKKLAQIHEDLPRRHGQAANSRIKLDLVAISNVQRETNSSVSRLEERVDATSTGVSQLGRSLLSSQQLQNQTISSLEDFRHDTSQRLDNLETIISTNNNILQTLPALLGVQIQAVLHSSTSTISTQALMGSSDEQTLETTTNIRTSTLHSTYQSIMVQAQYRHPDSCDLACQCRCHIPETRVTPSLLSNLLGRMYIGYKGIPVLAKTCTETKCKRDSQPKVYLSYFFPTWWIVDRMMILLAQWTTARGPELVLRFPSRVGINSPVFSFAESGNIEGLKSLFNSGKASPNDVDNDGNNVLCHAFVTSDYPETCRFLISAGADPEGEDGFGRNIGNEMCRGVFLGKRHPAWVQWVTTTFLSRKSEGFGFSSLHEIVLKLRYTLLDAEISRLSASPGALDARDIWGYTPLHWACIRNDFDAVRQLHESGAELEIHNAVGATPLLLSAQFGALDCATYLLHHNASAQSRSVFGWNALHYLCAYIEYQPAKEKVFAFLDTLLSKGLDINALTGNGTFASGVLLSLQGSYFGANVPLKWLLDHGADYKAKFLDGGTILHELGKKGNLEAVQILREAHLCGIDIHAKFYDTGETAMDKILDPSRETTATEELIVSFTQLLSEIEARTKGEGVPVAEDREEDTTMLPEIGASNIDTPPISEKRTQGFDGGMVTLLEDSEDEELLFQDSVEFQIPIIFSV